MVVRGYPTHDDRYVHQMAYYRQREWRIIGDIAVSGRLTMRDLTEDEKTAILECNRTFSSEKLTCLTASAAVSINAGYIFPPMVDTHFTPHVE